MAFEETRRQLIRRLNSVGELEAITSRDGEYTVYFLHGEALENYHAIEYYDRAQNYWEEGEFVYPDEDSPFPTIDNGDENIPAKDLKLRFDKEVIEMDY